MSTGALSAPSVDGETSNIVWTRESCSYALSHDSAIPQVCIAPNCFEVFNNPPCISFRTASGQAERKSEFPTVGLSP